MRSGEREELLSSREIAQLYHVALFLRLDRNALLSGIDQAFVQTMPVYASASEQVLHDLDRLNSAGILRDGSVPLLAWLHAATSMVSGRHYALIFERAIDVVTERLAERSPSMASTGRVSPSPSAPEPDEATGPITERLPPGPSHLADTTEASTLLATSALPTIPIQPRWKVDVAIATIELIRKRVIAMSPATATLLPTAPSSKDEETNLPDATEPSTLLVSSESRSPSLPTSSPWNNDDTIGPIGKGTIAMSPATATLLPTALSSKDEETTEPTTGRYASLPTASSSDDEEPTRPITLPLGDNSAHASSELSAGPLAELVETSDPGSPSTPSPAAVPRPGVLKRIRRAFARSVATPALAVVTPPAELRGPRRPQQWVRAYRPSWVLPRQRSSLRIYIFVPEVQDAVRREAKAALDMQGNPARETMAEPLRRDLEVGEPIVVRVDLPGFHFGEPEPEPWHPPYVRVIVTVDVGAGVAPGVYRPLVTVRSGRASGQLLKTFDFDLQVLAKNPRRANLRSVLGLGGLALGLAFVTATQQQSLSPTLGVPAGAACLAGGVGAWIMMGPEMIMSEIRDQTTDILIVTAVEDEYKAVLQVDTGATPGSGWITRPGSTNVDVAFRTFDTSSGPLRVAVVQALGMGATNAVAVSAQLIKDYGVRCLAMCGVCAGRRGEVALGDVIVADRLWQYDTGKHKVTTDEAGSPVTRDQADMDMYKIRPPKWAQSAQRFELDPNAAWLKERPRTYEEQGNWILERILHGVNPATDPARKTMCEHYGPTLQRLWRKGLLQNKKPALTDAGREHIEEILVLHPDGVPEPPPLRVHVGPIASGNKVIEDAAIFPLLADSVRKVSGVEMEAAALATLAHLQALPHFVVMKGVMDHADADKSDNFKGFAARASAEVLIAFLRQNLPPREGSSA